MSHSFIYLHEIVKMQNFSRKARGPDKARGPEVGDRCSRWLPKSTSFKANDAAEANAAIY